MDDKRKQQLREEIDAWLEASQENEETHFDMYMSDTLVDAMTEAAWNVLEESRNTQEWLKRQGLWDGN